MIVRNRLREVELVKQLALALTTPPHHHPPPRLAPGNGITLAVCLQPTFATLSAKGGRALSAATRHPGRPGGSASMSWASFPFFAALMPLDPLENTSVHSPPSVARQ